MIENVLNFPILTLLILLPALGAVVIAFIPARSKEVIRTTALGFALVNFCISLVPLFYFDTSTYKMQFVELASWIPGIGVSYFLGIDGISLTLLLLTTFLSIIAVLCSWTAIEERVKEYMIYLLVLETGMLGVFCSLDMILFFLFWEIGLIPMYFLIGVFGGPRKLYANIKFFLYTLFGSVFMLVGILALYYSHGNMTGEYTFNLLKLYEVVYPYNLQWWIFAVFFLGFAIKVPVFPFHTWLPDAHVEAPTAGSVLLAGVLLKMGTYGFLRFNLPLLADATRVFTPYIIALAVIGIVYGAFLALAQTDVKKLVAYSSVSHLGAVMAGIFALNQQGIDGGVLQMINHGISTGGLFLMIGIIYERRHTRQIADFGGLARVMPVYVALSMVIVLSSIGLPGTNGFIGEILILLGLFKASPVAAVLGATGVILGAAYMLWMFQRVAFGQVKHPENEKLKDLSAREVIVLLPMIALILWIGIYPKHVLGLTSATTAHLSEVVKMNSIKTEVAEIGLVHEAGAVEHAPALEGAAPEQHAPGDSPENTPEHAPAEGGRR
ncbi:MAG: NuoM family protein [Thermodesulfobacteriota bacterium]